MIKNKKNAAFAFLRLQQALRLLQMIDGSELSGFIRAEEDLKEISGDIQAYLMPGFAGTNEEALAKAKEIQDGR
jgi:hypothetical protein